MDHLSTSDIVVPRPLAEMLRFDLDPAWSGLRDDERARACAWREVLAAMEGAGDKAGALVACRRRHGGTLGSMSQSTVYRVMGEIRANGLAGAVGARAMARAMGVGREAEALPRGFVVWWEALCGTHQRRKVLAVWRHLMRDWLMAGRVIPGYECDWRGIWLSERSYSMVPQMCPYTDIHAGAGASAPRGWSYSALKRLAPTDDVWRGATVGVQAMQQFNPSIPHTRVGLRPMQVITMDDVTLDAYAWYPGERRPRRPVGLGTLDIATGHMVSWQLVPVRERPDGSSNHLDALQRRYTDAWLFCGVGIDAAAGVTMLLEYGTAGMADAEVDRLNAILGPRPNGEPWLRVIRSSTSGAPVVRGLFRERGRGRPTHKAMLEASWNLLHNEAAMLPGPSGKDWDHAPQDQEGWEREDRALISAGAALLARECPDAIDVLGRARTHALPYTEISAAYRAIIGVINHRRDHDLEGWADAGYMRSCVDIGGTLMSLDDAARSIGAGDNDRLLDARAMLAALQRPVAMSPAEAWAHCGGGRDLRRWPAFVATRILGPELAQRVEVSRRRELIAVHPWSGAKMSYAAVTQECPGAPRTHLEPGVQVDMWINPYAEDSALVCDADGRWMGAAPYLRPTIHGERTDTANLATLAVMRGEQQRRVETAAAGRVARETARRAANERVLAEAATVPDSQLRDLVETIAAEYHGGGYDDFA